MTEMERELRLAALALEGEITSYVGGFTSSSGRRLYFVTLLRRAADALRDTAAAIGSKGGKARAAKLDPARRRAIATKASQAAAAVRTARRATPPPPTDSPSGGHDSGPSSLST